MLEAGRHREARAEQRHHVLGRGVGGDVEVGGDAAEQEIAHAAAHEVRLASGGAQALAHGDDVVRDAGAIDGVHVERSCRERPQPAAPVPFPEAASSRASACAAALCSASFFDLPPARPYSSPPSEIATQNVLSWSGPSWPTTA